MKLNIIQTIGLLIFTAGFGTAQFSKAAPIKLEATYASIKANIIDAKCLKCHSPGGKAEDIPYETKEQLLHGEITDVGPVLTPGKALTSPFFQVMNKDTSIRGSLKLMPPQKAVDAGTVKPVTPEELTIVEAWINAGATN